MLWTDQEYELAVIQAWTGLIAANSAVDPIRTAQKAITLANELEVALEEEYVRRDAKTKQAPNP